MYAKEADGSAVHQEIISAQTRGSGATFNFEECVESESFPEVVVLNAGWRSAQLTKVLHMYLPCMSVSMLLYFKVFLPSSSDEICLHSRHYA